MVVWYLGTFSFVEKNVANSSRIILISAPGILIMLRMSSKDPMLFCSCRYAGTAGIICPSSYSISNVPFGEY